MPLENTQDYVLLDNLCWPGWLWSSSVPTMHSWLGRIAITDGLHIQFYLRFSDGQHLWSNRRIVGLN